MSLAMNQLYFTAKKVEFWIHSPLKMYLQHKKQTKKFVMCLKKVLMKEKNAFTWNIKL